MSDRSDCPSCGGSTICTDSRRSRGPAEVRRRIRKCGDCGLTFTTMELVVGRSDGSSAGVFDMRASDQANRAAEFVRQVEALAQSALPRSHDGYAPRRHKPGQHTTPERTKALVARRTAAMKDGG